MDEIVGIKYKLVKSDNFEEYLKACGIDFMVRKRIASFTPILELIDNNDGSFSVKTSVSSKNAFINFKLNEEFDQEFLDGRKVKTVITSIGDNKLLEVQRGEKQVTLTWEFTMDQVLITFCIGAITATRCYKAINQ